MRIPKFEEIKTHKFIEKFLSEQYPEFLSLLVELPGKTISEKVYLYYHDMVDIPKCPVCGKDLPFMYLSRGYRMYCSIDCKKNDPNWVSRVTESNQKTYHDKKEEIFKKSQNTKLKLYGDPNYVNVQKQKQTNLERYGVACTLHSEEGKQKVKQTCLEKYGVENVFQLPETQSRCRLTTENKYGGLGWGSKIIKEKTLSAYKKSFLEKHPDIIDVKYGGSQKQTIYTCRCPHPECNLCDQKTYDIDSLLYWVRLGDVETCTHILPVAIVKEESSIELFVQSRLDEWGVNYEKHNRSLLSGRELDIYIPGKNLAIECNGIYWHSSYHKDCSYHAEKYTLCKEKDTQLITLWEDWIIQKPNIVESLLKNKLGLCDHRVYARQCTIEQITQKESEEFLNKNHIQGSVTSPIRLGLYYDGELVSLMTFCKKRICMGSKTKSNIYELSRFCNKLNTNVVGGASKLLKHFEQEYNSPIIESFASHDISNGHLYETLGFELQTQSDSSYWYIDNKFNRYHRYHFTKHKLVEEGYDENKSESEIMMERGFYKIFDTGQSKYIKNACELNTGI